MSLLSQTARYLLLTAFGVTLVGAVGFYVLIHHQIRHEVDEILTSQVKQTEQRLQRNPLATVAEWDDNPRIERTSVPVRPTFSDIRLPDSLNHNRPMPIRQLRATVTANGQLYLVTIQQPYYEFNELARELSVGIIICFLGLMGLSVIVGLGLSRRLWRPFHATIDQLGTFRLDQATDPVFPPSTVQEFTLLNQSLSTLTRKLRQQYSLQKQFTENASHELQTPLAVASAELDFLLQSEHLTAIDHAHLQRATDALRRLSQLNRSLLLLTQVENNQFAHTDRIDVSDLLNQYIEEYRPFFEHKHMHIDTSIASAIEIRLNRQLAGVLLSNLLKNAARHGSVSGSVRVDLTASQLMVQNTGEPLPFSDSQLFNRFVKNPARPDSTGLGLALVKQVCDRYGLPLAYAYDPAVKMHTFRIGLPPLTETLPQAPN